MLAKFIPAHQTSANEPNCTVWTIHTDQPKLLDLLTRPETFELIVETRPRLEIRNWMNVGEAMMLISVIYQLSGCTPDPLSPQQLEKIDPSLERKWLNAIGMLEEPLKKAIEEELRRIMSRMFPYPRFIYKKVS